MLKSLSTTQWQAIRYLVGGASSAVVSSFLLLVFVELADLHYLLGTNLTTGFLIFYSYVVNKYFVFRDRENAHLLKGSKFLLLQTIMLALTNLFMYTTVSGLGVHYLIAIVTWWIVAAAISFTIMKLRIFDSESGLLSSKIENKDVC